MPRGLQDAACHLKKNSARFLFRAGAEFRCIHQVDGLILESAYGRLMFVSKIPWKNRLLRSIGSPVVSRNPEAHFLISF